MSSGKQGDETEVHDLILVLDDPRHDPVQPAIHLAHIYEILYLTALQTTSMNQSRKSSLYNMFPERLSLLLSAPCPETLNLYIPSRT